MKFRGGIGPMQFSGSMAGMTASHNRYGPYFRARAIPVNRNTPLQVAIRAAMGVMSNRWTVIVTAVQRAAWEAYAAETPLTDSFGEEIFLPGRNMYIRSNNFRESVGIPPIDDAPTTPGVGVPCGLTITATVADGIEIQSSTPTLVSGDVCAVRIGNPVNQSKNFYDSPFSFVLGIGSTSSFPLLLKPAGEVFVGQRYFFINRLFGADGKVSNDIIDQIDVLA